MAAERFTEGKAPFAIPSLSEPCETYYKIYGDLHNGRPPIIVLHGGPGSGHNYLLAFRALWERHQLPVIFYDQIGCGKSTHLRSRTHDHTFWTIDLMTLQLSSLITHLHLTSPEKPGYFLLGHSAGGMTAAYFATRRPEGLRKLVLANAPGSIDLHVHGLELCGRELPGEAPRALEEARRTGDWEAESYLDALALLNRTNWCRADPLPEELEESGRNHQADSTLTDSMWGRTPFELVGSLKGWNCFGDLPKINVPTLLYHGEWDIERDEVVAPYVEHVPGIRKVTVERASHMSHLDNEDCQERVLELVSSFLLENWFALE